MRTGNRKALVLLAVCGTVGSAAGLASAQPHTLNLGGATLLENFFKAPASTNDYFDVDGNGIARKFGTNQQLAPFGLPPDGGTQHWIVLYSAIGSVNGVQELVTFGRTFVTTGFDDPNGLPASASTASYCNRTQFITNGVKSNGIFNAGNPRGFPVRQTMDGNYLSTYSAPDTPSAGGVQHDIAPVDVPTAWAVFYDGVPAFDDLPTEEGYGSNPRLSVNKQGGKEGAEFSSKLANLGDCNIFDPNNPQNADENTIFDTSIAFAPIAPIVSLGVGMQQIDISDLQHLTVTGRLKSGENLMMVTRDSGSGTRNGFMNSIGVDPSWGVGENIGGLSVLSPLNLLGPNFQPGNKGGTGGVETTSQNHRLAIGYVGAERGVNTGWLTGGRLEILAVRNDLKGGSQFARPTISNVLDNTYDTWSIGGPAVLASIGDPRSAPVNKGGDADNAHPDMRNVEAAAYINNVSLSIEAFAGDPGGDASLFTPGEWIGVNLIPTASTDNVQNPLDPTDLIVNQNLNQALQDYVRSHNVLGNPAYAQFGLATLDGLVPTREKVMVYSDGVPGGNNYIDQAGAIVTYADKLKKRNRISGDFNGDAKRNLNDAAEMMKAWKHRNGGPNWAAPNGTGDISGAPGTEAVIEILGDFNGDGNFDAADVRYWADGLAIDVNSLKLNRAAGFLAVDNAAAGNFFGTSIKTGKPYTNGAARGDVSNSKHLNTRGFAPIGADGMIDGFDIDYVYKQFKANIGGDGEATWADLDEASRFDLSGDITGDLLVNQLDVDDLVLGILQTNYGDVNLDGVVNQSDKDIIIGNLGEDGGWADGDINGDGKVTEDDLAFGCYADCDGSGELDIDDFICFQTAFGIGDSYADCDNSGELDIDDFICFQTSFGIGCP